MTIGVIARIKVAAGKQEQFERVMGELAAAIRAHEPGNKMYEVCRSRSQATEYVVLEIYASEHALEQHKGSEHMRIAGPKLAAVFAGRPAIEVFDALT